MSDEHRTYITFDAPNQPKARPKLGFRDISGFEPLAKKQDTTNDKKINEWEELESISYFKALDLVSEGPIEGFCDPAGNSVSGSGILKGIYLDNTPILNENDTINYRDVSTVLMHGTTGQDAIYTGQTGAFQWMEDFSYVSQTKSKGIVLPSASSFGGKPTASFDGHHTIQDSDVDWVALTFNIGRLNAIDLNSDDGEIVPNSLKLRIEGDYTGVLHHTMVDDTNLGDWESQVDGKLLDPVTGTCTTDLTINGIATSPYQEDILFKLVDGRDEEGKRRTNRRISVRNLTSLPENFSRVHSVKLESVTEIIKSNMSYPGSAQVGSLIRANYLPRAPERTFHLKLKKVKVPSIYVENDDALQSRHPGTWDGTFKDELEWTDNPAWIFYDIATNERYGLGEYVKEENIDKWQLFKIAKYCDEPVPTSRGNTSYQPGAPENEKYVQERRFSCNLFLNNKMEAYKALSEIASVFKGMAFYNGSEVYVSQDSLSEPVLNFTNSNVLEGNFTYHGSSKNTRFTAVKVAYKDKDDNFLPKYEYIEDPEGIIRHGLIEKESAALGCTSRDQALRLGRWILLTSNNEQEVVRFSTDKQGGYLRPGDVIGISDDNRTNFKSGGRVAKVVGDNAISVDENHILLDQTLDIDEANFKYLKISFIIPNSGKLSEDDEEGVGAEKQFKTFIHRKGHHAGAIDGGHRSDLIPLNSQTSDNIKAGVYLHNYFENTNEGTKIKTTMFLDMLQESPNKNDEFMQGGALHPGTLNDYFLESGVFQANAGFVQHQDRANNNQQKITEGAVYIVEASGDARQQTKEFRVLAVAEEDDATFTIAALEYNRDKFKDVDSLSTIYKSSTQLISVTPSYGDTQPNDRQGVPPPTPESEIFTPTIIGGIPDNNVSLSINRTGDLDQNDGTFNPKIELYFFNDYGNEGQNVTHFDYKIQEISNVYYEKLKDAGSVEQATGLYHSLKDGSYVKNDKCGDFGEISFLTGSKGSEFYDPTIPNFRSDFTDKVISEVGVGIEKIEFSGIEKCAGSNSTPSLHLYSGVKTEVGALKEETWHEIRWKASRKHTISDASSEEKVAFFRSSADITPPAKPSSFEGKILFNNLYEFNWENTADADLDLVRLYTGDGAVKIGNPIYELQANPLSNQFHTFFIGNHPELKNDINQDFYITSVDLAGNESIDSASVIVSRIGDSSSVPIIDVSSSFDSIERQSYVKVDIDSGNFNTNPGYNLSNPGADNDPDKHGELLDPNFEKYQVTIYESGTENILSTYDIVEELIDEHEVTYSSIGGKKYEVRLDVVTKGGDYVFGERSGILAAGDNSIPESLENFEVDLHFGNRVEIEWTYPANVNDIEYVEIYSGSGIGELEPNTDPWPSTWAKVDEVPRSRSYATQYLTDSLKEKLGKTTNKALHYAAKPIDYSDHEGLITSGSIHFWDYKTDEYGFQSNDSTDWDTEVKVLTGVNGNWEFSGHYEHAVAPSLLDPDFENFQAWVYNAENNNFLTYVDLDPVDHTGHYTAIPGKPLEFRLVAKRKTGDVKWSHKTPTAELLDDTPPGKLTNFEGEIWFNNLYRFGWDAPPENDIEKIQLYTGESNPRLLLEKFEPTSQEIIFSIEKYSDLATTEKFYIKAVDFSNNISEGSSFTPGDWRTVSRLGSDSSDFASLNFEAGEDGSFVTGNITPNNPGIENDSNFLEYRVRIWDNNSSNPFPLDVQYLDNAQAGEDIRYEGIPGKQYKIDFCVHTKDGNYICKPDLDVTLLPDEEAPAAIENFNVKQVFDDLVFTWDAPPEEDCETIVICSGVDDSDSNLKNTPSPASKIYKSGIGKYSVFSEPTQSFFDEGFRDTIAFNAFAVDLSKNSGDFGSVVQEVGFALDWEKDIEDVTTGILESITPEGNTRYFLTGKACHESVESKSFHHGRFRVGPESHFALKSETYLVSDIEGANCLKFSSEVLPNIEYKITLSLENSTNERLTKDHFEGEFKIPSDNIAPSEVTDLNASQIGNAFHVTWKDVNAEQDLKGYIVSTGIALNDLKEYSFVDKSQKFARVPLKNNSADYFIGIKKQDTSLNVGAPVVEQVNFSYEAWNSIANNPTLTTGSDLDSGDGSYNVYIEANITYLNLPDDLELITVALYKGNNGRIIQTKTILPSENNVRFDGLLANQLYKVKATPIYLNGISGDSSALVEKTTGKDDTIPGDPSNFGVSVGAKQMYLTWDWATNGRAKDLEALNVYRISGVAISDPTNTEWKLENPKYTIEPGGNEGGSFIDADIETGNANGAISYAYAIQAVDRSLNTGNYIPSIPPQLPGSGITDDYIHGIKAGKILSDSITSHTIALGRKGNERGRFISEDVISVSQGTGIYLDALNFRIGDPDGQGIFYTGEYEFGSNQEDRRFEIRGDMTAGTIDIGNNKKEAFSVNPEGEIMIGQVEAIKKEGLSYLYLGDTLPEVTGLFSSVRTTTDGFNVYLQDHFAGAGGNFQGQFKTSDMFLRVYKGGMDNTTDIKTYPITGHQTEQKVGIYEKDSISYETTDAYAVFDVRFLVTSDGILYAKQANIAGTVTASSFRADETMEIGEGGDKDPEHSILQSFNYDGTISHPIPSGWRLQGHGKAQFYDVGIHGPNSYIEGIDHLLVGSTTDSAFFVNSDGNFGIGKDLSVLANNNFYVTSAGILNAKGANIYGNTTIGGDTLIEAGVKIGNDSNGVEITAAGLKSSTNIGPNPAWEINGNGSASFRDVTSINISAGSIAGTTLDVGTLDGFHVDNAGNLHIGHANFNDAPFSVDKDGNLKATSATLEGTIGGAGFKAGATTNQHVYISSVGIYGPVATEADRKFWIKPDGEAIFKNIKVQGGSIDGAVTLDVGNTAGTHGRAFHVEPDGGISIGDEDTAPGSRKFEVDNAGNVSMENLTLEGDLIAKGGGIQIKEENWQSPGSYLEILSTEIASRGDNNTNNWVIGADGSAEFSNINIEGGSLSAVSMAIGAGGQWFNVGGDGQLSIGDYRVVGDEAETNKEHSHNKFHVDQNGELFAKDANIEGELWVKTGSKIGGATSATPSWYVTSSAIQNNDPNEINDPILAKIESNGKFKLKHIESVNGNLEVGHIKSHDYVDVGTNKGFNLQIGTNPSTIPNFLTDDDSAKKIAEQVSTQFCGEILYPVDGQEYTLISNNRIEYKITEVDLEFSGPGSVDPTVSIDFIGNGTWVDTSTIIEGAPATHKILGTTDNHMRIKTDDAKGKTSIQFNIKLQRN